MTWARVAAVGFLVWIVALVIALQPRSHPVPVVRHARPLEVTVGDLPTLPLVRPVGPSR